MQVCMHTNRQTYAHIDIYIAKLADGQRERQPDRKTNRYTEIQPDSAKQTDYTERQTERQAYRQPEGHYGYIERMTDE